MSDFLDSFGIAVLVTQVSEHGLVLVLEFTLDCFGRFDSHMFLVSIIHFGCFGIAFWEIFGLIVLEVQVSEFRLVLVPKFKVEGFGCFGNHIHLVPIICFGCLDRPVSSKSFPAHRIVHEVILPQMRSNNMLVCAQAVIAMMTVRCHIEMHLMPGRQPIWVLKI